jgi:hypothetical protein
MVFGIRSVRFTGSERYIGGAGKHAKPPATPGCGCRITQDGVRNESHEQDQSEDRSAPGVRTARGGGGTQHGQAAEGFVKEERRNDPAGFPYRGVRPDRKRTNRLACGCPRTARRLPLRRAASGCHDTRDHLLLAKTPRGNRSPASSHARASVRRTTLRTTRVPARLACESRRLKYYSAARLRVQPRHRGWDRFLDPAAEQGIAGVQAPPARPTGRGLGFASALGFEASRRRRTSSR